jgi:V/A-type H+-transporting ATPase subunit D
MELMRLKGKLRVAVKGHKLLKDKFDEMMRQFNTRIKACKSMREEVDGTVHDALRSFLLARTQLTNQQIEDAVCMPNIKYEITEGIENIMGVLVPKVNMEVAEAQPRNFMNRFVKSTITELQCVTEKLLILAASEKACEMLAAEIEKNRRRINALEHILIPETRETIKKITLKLGENERQNIARLMKVKRNAQ